MDRVLLEKCRDLQRASDRMAIISSHNALVILKHSLGSTRMLYVLRASPCTSKTAFLFQRVSVMVQRANAIALHGTFVTEESDD
jgi:hypothetical protein